ncbi:MAG: PilZ domain-containing protein [Treponema sp.]|jgi:hypothetical protein|nr:PilZ domain-containing protein [Treponema sp.]
MDDNKGDSEFAGKKVFFLFPSATVQNGVIPELVQNEYEVYLAYNKDTIRRVLRKYPDSIVLVDTGEKMPEREWEQWVRTVMKAPDTASIAIGVVTTHGEAALKGKYLGELKVAAGFTILGQDMAANIRTVFEALHGLDAKGRRKYVRAADLDGNATINIPINGEFVKGRVRDISAVGISFDLEDSPAIEKNSVLKDVQIVLQSGRVNVEGILFGSREGKTETIYVMLFAQKTDFEARAKIRKHVQHALQSRMDLELR